jgi:hypothetical protein
MSGPILLVDDDENDVFFMLDAFKKAGVQTPVQVVHDGKEATDYPERQRQFQRSRAVSCSVPGVAGFEAAVRDGIGRIKGDSAGIESPGYCGDSERLAGGRGHQCGLSFGRKRLLS